MEPKAVAFRRGVDPPGREEKLWQPVLPEKVGRRGEFRGKKIVVHVNKVAGKIANFMDVHFDRASIKRRQMSMVRKYFLVRHDPDPLASPQPAGDLSVRHDINLSHPGHILLHRTERIAQVVEIAKAVGNNGVGLGAPAAVVGRPGFPQPFQKSFFGAVHPSIYQIDRLPIERPACVNGEFVH